MNQSVHHIVLWHNTVQWLLGCLEGSFSNHHHPLSSATHTSVEMLYHVLSLRLFQDFLCLPPLHPPSTVFWKITLQRLSWWVQEQTRQASCMLQLTKVVFDSSHMHLPYFQHRHLMNIKLANINIEGKEWHSAIWCLIITVDDHYETEIISSITVDKQVFRDKQTHLTNINIELQKEESLHTSGP